MEAAPGLRKSCAGNPVPRRFWLFGRAKKAPFYEDKRLQQRILPPPSVQLDHRPPATVPDDEWSVLADVVTVANPVIGRTANEDLGNAGIHIKRQMELLERDVGIGAETLALFIRFWLIATPSLPEQTQPAARAKGQERYENFLQALGRRLAKGPSFLRELSLDHGNTSPVPKSASASHLSLQE
jgi:hypothetical protein